MAFAEQRDQGEIDDFGFSDQDRRQAGAQPLGQPTDAVDSLGPRLGRPIPVVTSLTEHGCDSTLPTIDSAIFRVYSRHPCSRLALVPHSAATVSRARSGGAAWARCSGL